MNNNLITTRLTTNNLLILAALLSAGLLAGALFFEHVLNYAPCQMCYWQRDAHKAVILVAVLGLLIRAVVKSPKWDRVLLFLVGLAFVVSFGMAIWHMGVEYKWWLGPKSCAAPPPSQIDTGSILEALNNGGKLPQCSDAPWDLFGISMAGYNALISGAAALVLFVLAVKGSRK